MTIKFEIQDDQRLKEKAKLTGKDINEFISDALSVYEHLLQQRINGNRIFLGKTKEGSTEFRVSTFEVAVLKKEFSK